MVFFRYAGVGVNLPAIIAMSPAIVRGFLPLADPSTAHSYSAKIIAVALPVIGRKVERAGREMRMPKFVEVLPWPGWPQIKTPCWP